MRDWQPLVDRIGSPLDSLLDDGGGPPQFGPDVVELSAIRRWLEPLEFDSRCTASGGSSEIMRDIIARRRLKVSPLR